MTRPCKWCWKYYDQHSLVTLCLIDEKYDTHWGPGGSGYEPMDNLEYMNWKYEQRKR